MMKLEMVYADPIWEVGLMLMGMAAAGAVFVELAARRILPLALRRSHTNVAAAMFTVIGTTFAVLLAFIAMLAWDDFGAARTAAATEATVVRDVANAAAGLSEPVRTQLRDGVAAYLGAVISREWPAQAAGQLDQSAAKALGSLDALAAAYQPVTAGETNFHAALIAGLARMHDARALRQLSASDSLPTIVWVVLVLGGSLTVASGSFLGAPSLAMHLAMSVTLAVSGALVMLLIVALSQPFRGDFRVSTVAYQAVLDDLASGEKP